jgi:hypothetical protein
MGGIQFRSDAKLAVTSYFLGWLLIVVKQFRTYYHTPFLAWLHYAGNEFTLWIELFGKQ